MRATTAPGSLHPPAKKPSVLTGVARMSEATSGKGCPAYRCAHAGYGCAGGIAGAREEALRVDRCSPDERSDIRGKTAPHIAALMRATVAATAVAADFVRHPTVRTGNRSTLVRYHAKRLAQPNHFLPVVREKCSSVENEPDPRAPDQRRGDRRMRFHGRQ